MPENCLNESPHNYSGNFFATTRNLQEFTRLHNPAH
jgi:hypothetical protein